MRFSTALFALAAASYASASALYARQTLPTCADNCYATATSDKCSLDDEACLCNDQQFVESTTICVEEACSGTDLTNALAYSTALCEQVGVTLTSTFPIPTSSGASSSTSGSTSASTTSVSSTSSTSSAPTTSTSSNAAISHGVNALGGLVAVAVAALAL